MEEWTSHEQMTGTDQNAKHTLSPTSKTQQ